MSLLTKSIGMAKRSSTASGPDPGAPVYLSPVRRIEQVALEERVCAA